MLLFCLSDRKTKTQTQSLFQSLAHARTHTHTHTHTHIHAQKHTHTHTNIHAHTHTNTHAYPQTDRLFLTQTRARARAHTHTRTHTHTHTRTHIRNLLSLSLSLSHAHAHIHRHTNTHIQLHKHSHPNRHSRARACVARVHACPVFLTLTSSMHLDICTTLNNTDKRSRIVFRPEQNSGLITCISNHAMWRIQLLIQHTRTLHTLQSALSKNSSPPSAELGPLVCRMHIQSPVLCQRIVTTMRSPEQGCPATAPDPPPAQCGSPSRELAS